MKTHDVQDIDQQVMEMIRSKEHFSLFKIYFINLMIKTKKQKKKKLKRKQLKIIYRTIFDREELGIWQKHH